MNNNKRIYTEDEVEEVREWILEREEFKDSGTSNRVRSSDSGIAILGTSLFTGFITLFFLYAPVWVLFTMSNNSLGGIFKYISLDVILTDSTTGQGGFNPMAFLFSSFIVALAVIGGASIVGWVCMLFASSNDDKWYENEIKKSEKMCDVALQEAEKPLKAEIDLLNGKLLDSDIKYSKLSDEYAILKKKFTHNNDLFKREKKLWSLEKKELQYQIKLKQGLVDEMDDSESPLGGLYN